MKIESLRNRLYDLFGQSTVKATQSRIEKKHELSREYYAIGYALLSIVSAIDNNDLSKINIDIENTNNDGD